MRVNRGWLPVIAIGLLFLGSSVAEAQNRGRARRGRPTVAQRLSQRRAAQQRSGQQQAAPAARGMARKLQCFIRDNRLPCFTKNGKPFFAMKRNTNTAPYLQLGKNVVEFFVSPGFHHLYTRVGDQTYSRITGLSKSKWYKASSERIGVLVELKDREMTKLKSFLDRAHANPREVIGRFEYNGGRFPEVSNCTSYITNAPIGPRGETLARVCGVYPSGFPQGFLRSLMRTNNERVKGIVVHAPSGQFTQNYRLNLE